MSATSTPSPSSPTSRTTARAWAADSAARPALRARRSSRWAAERFAITAVASASASSAASETRNRSSLATYAPRRRARVSAASQTLVLPVRRGPATIRCVPASSRVAISRTSSRRPISWLAGMGESEGKRSPLACRIDAKAYTDFV